jgi:hypothetical protein
MTDPPVAKLALQRPHRVREPSDRRRLAVRPLHQLLRRLAAVQHLPSRAVTGASFLCLITPIYMSFVWGLYGDCMREHI